MFFLKQSDKSIMDNIIIYRKLSILILYAYLSGIFTEESSWVLYSPIPNQKIYIIKYLNKSL